MCSILTNSRRPVKCFSQNNQIFASVRPSGALFPLRRKLFLPAILPRLHKTPRQTREKIGGSVFSCGNDHLRESYTLHLFFQSSGQNPLHFFKSKENFNKPAAAPRKRQNATKKRRSLALASFLCCFLLRCT